MSADPADEPQRVADGNTLARLAAIEDHLHQIETRLGAIGEFNGRLNEIHAILETVIGLVTPDRINEPLAKSTTRADGSPGDAGFRVGAHVSRDDDGTRLISDVWWPDTWSARMFVTALLRNLASNDHAKERRRCWCEVWTPDETGDCVDSAVLDPDTGAIEWESDIVRGTELS